MAWLIAGDIVVASTSHTCWCASPPLILLPRHRLVDPPARDRRALQRPSVPAGGLPLVPAALRPGLLVPGWCTTALPRRQVRTRRGKHATTIFQSFRYADHAPVRLPHPLMSLQVRRVGRAADACLHCHVSGRALLPRADHHAAAMPRR